MNSQVLVLDANILIRAVLGNKVRDYIIKYNDEVDFFTPEVCIEDAGKYLPQLFVNREISPEPALEVLRHIQDMLKVVTLDIYIKIIKKTLYDASRQETSMTGPLLPLH